METGVPSRAYQLTLTTDRLYRAGIEATSPICRKTFNKPFFFFGAALKRASAGRVQGLATAKI